MNQISTSLSGTLRVILKIKSTVDVIKNLKCWRNRPKLPDTVSPKNCPLSIWLSKQKELVSLDKRNVNKNYVYHFSIGTKRDVTRWQTNTERTHTRMNDFYVLQRLGVSRMRKHIKHLVMVSSNDTDIHTYIHTHIEQFNDRSISNVFSNIGKC